MAITTGTYSARPSSHSAGDIYLTTDSFWDYLVSDSSKWKHLYSGFECEPPIDSEFSWLNQGGASLVTANGGVFLRAPATAGTNRRIRVKSAPATPYILTAIMLPAIVGATDAGECLLGFRDSTYEGMQFLMLGMRSGVTYLSVANVNSPTGSEFGTYNGDLGIHRSSPAIWLQLEDNGTTLYFRFSQDGQNFLTVYSLGRTAEPWTNGPPDQLFFGVGATGGYTYDCGVTLIHWSQPNPVSTMRVWGFLLGSGMASGYGSGNVRGAFG